jgi:hypothetical protein
MRSKFPHFSIAIGIPSGPQYARDDEPGGQPDGNDGSESLMSVIFRKLREGDEAAANAVIALGDCLQRAGEAALKDDQQKIITWIDRCQDFVDHLVEDE